MTFPVENGICSNFSEKGFFCLSQVLFGKTERIYIISFYQTWDCVKSEGNWFVPLKSRKFEEEYCFVRSNFGSGCADTHLFACKCCSFQREPRVTLKAMQ